MALTDAQRRLLERYLSPRTGEELEQPTAKITVTKRQLAFLIEAIEHFHDTRCPLEGADSGCGLRTWHEDASTGAMALLCPTACTSWRDTLIEEVVPRAFPVPLP